ncbi:MAG TPA: serine hydrolase domain-containing protein [Sphingomicrobium sp.]|jgi:CubicO group peptidase (beta-lactamase class C family)|nr:serine hydrolase domain-containing protein [Sphingomicrobium sp.]
MLRISAALLALAASAASARPLTPSEVSQVDQLVTKTLSETGVPSAEIAIVSDGKLVLNKAYGKANEALSASPELPYQIASNSKQFTAMAILLLRDEGKLSLDDPVSKFIPGITEGDRITIRELLSHESGLQDFWPQDYSFIDMEQPTTPQHIVDKWAKKPLDFQPGTRWQYSNTGYVVAGMIAEKVSGQPLLAYLHRKIFDPLGMTSVHDQDDTNTPAFPAGYERNALGPVRVARQPGRGWLYAAGELSMTAADLAKWDIARMNRSLIPARDWLEQETPVLRGDGRTNGYGLGVYSINERERRVIDHGGEAVGFLTQNTVYPDTRNAIIVFTNSDFSGASGTLTSGIEKIVLNSPEPALTNESDREADVRTVYKMIASGQLDRSKFTGNLNYYFDPTRLGDYRTSLAPLGAPTSFESLGAPRLRGGFVNRNFTIHYSGGKDLTLITYSEPGADGRWEQFMIMPQ